jgi:hypothetical protein
MSSFDNIFQAIYDENKMTPNKPPAVNIEVSQKETCESNSKFGPESTAENITSNPNVYAGIPENLKNGCLGIMTGLNEIIEVNNQLISENNRLITENRQWQTRYSQAVEQLRRAHDSYNEEKARAEKTLSLVKKLACDVGFDAPTSSEIPVNKINHSQPVTTPPKNPFQGHPVVQSCGHEVPSVVHECHIKEKELPIQLEYYHRSTPGAVTVNFNTPKKPTKSGPPKICSWRSQTPDQSGDIHLPQELEEGPPELPTMAKFVQFTKEPEKNPQVTVSKVVTQVIEPCGTLFDKSIPNHNC